MAVLLPSKAQDGHLAFIPRREAGMAAFGAQGHPAALGRNQARHTQASACADHAHHAAFARLAATHRTALMGLKPRHRHGQRREVVDHQQRVQGQTQAFLFNGKLPVVVGHAHPVAFHRVGHGHGCMLDGGCCNAVEVGAHRAVKVRVVGAGDQAYLLQHAGSRFQGETGVGGADVGQQAGAGVGCGHGGWVGGAVMKLQKHRPFLGISM